MRFIHRYFWLLASVALLIVHASVAGTYTVTSDSMADTLRVGDTFLVCKACYGLRVPLTDMWLTRQTPERGDIVVFTYPVDPSKMLVKRIIAVAGQTVRIDSKQLYVDGEPVPLPPGGSHADPDTIPAGPTGSGKRDFLPETVVPEGTVFVLGDNRDYSVDSRIWGVLPIDMIHGRATRILMSFDPSVKWTDFGNKLRTERFLKPLE